MSPVPKVASRYGPLAGVKIVEFAGIGPVPFCCSLLASMGADIVRIDREQYRDEKPGDMTRGRRSIALNLKRRSDMETALQLLDRADALVEGFRPGVMERLGLGPETVLSRNAKLVYGRMTGWGQTGPLAHAAGHDINYISLSGALHAVGTPERPVPPLNLVGDYGGGAMYLGIGLLAAILHARNEGEGQVIDCSMVEGSASLMAQFYEAYAQGTMDARGSNMLDGGAPYYNPYQCSDGRWISLGSYEPQFYAMLIDTLGLLPEVDLDAQHDRTQWPHLKARIAQVVRGKTRDEWCSLMEGSDVCFAPVLDLAEAAQHPHNAARGSFVEIDGSFQPGPAPRFSRTPGQLGNKPDRIGADEEDVFADWGITAVKRGVESSI